MGAGQREDTTGDVGRSQAEDRVGRGTGHRYLITLSPQQPHRLQLDGERLGRLGDGTARLGGAHSPRIDAPVPGIEGNGLVPVARCRREDLAGPIGEQGGVERPTRCRRRGATPGYRHDNDPDQDSQHQRHGKPPPSE